MTQNVSQQLHSLQRRDDQEAGRYERAIKDGQLFESEWICMAHHVYPAGPRDQGPRNLPCGIRNFMDLDVCRVCSTRREDHSRAVDYDGVRKAGLIPSYLQALLRCDHTGVLDKTKAKAEVTNTEQRRGGGQTRGAC